MRRIEEQFYWEDYWERNEVDTDQKTREGGQTKIGESAECECGGE